MMKPNELFQLIVDTDYTKTGDEVDYAVKIFHEEKRIRLLFQESKGWRDWVNNFKFPIKPYKNQENVLWFAKGWANAYKSANDEIMEKLVQAHNENPDYDIEIAGWSYGGAMCLLAVEDFYYRTKLKCIVTTFGGPKPLFGRKTRQNILNCCKEINQYCHRNDIVTLLPPLFGYCMGRKVKVGKKKLFGLFFPYKYHTCYGDANLYE